MWRFLNGVKDPNQTKRGAEEQSAEKKKKQKEHDTKRIESGWRVGGWIRSQERGESGYCMMKQKKSSPVLCAGNIHQINPRSANSSLVQIILFETSTRLL